jgi:PKD repeat protein
VITLSVTLPSAAGSFCIDSGDAADDAYDWLFDDPQPSFDKTCWSMAVANNAPVLTPIGAKNVAEGANLTFTVNGTDSNGDALTFSATPLPTNATITPINGTSASFIFNPNYTQSGSYEVLFVASDGSLADSELVTITVTNTNRAPVLAAIGAKLVNENSNLNFNISASDPDGNIPSFTTSTLPTSAVFTDNGNGTGTFNWTPSYTQSGSYNVTFRTTDGSLLDTEIVTITVTNVNRDPVLAAIGARSVNENSNLNFNISANDLDGTTPSFTTSTLPTGAAFTDNGNGTGTFNWTPSYTQSGIYNVTFRASDGVALDTEIVTITVTNVNRPPILAAIGPKSVAKNTTLNINVSATDSDNDAIILTTSAMPANASFTDNGNGTGAFSFTPEQSQIGNIFITFRAFDGVVFDTETVQITVTDVNEPPVLAAIGPKSVNEGAFLFFMISATDPNMTKPVLSATNLPANASFQDSANGTGYFVFWPNYTQAGVYNVTFRASDGQFVDSEIVEITVNNVNRPPVLSINQPGPYNVFIDSALVLDLTAADADGDTPNISSTTLMPNAVLVDSGNGYGWFQFIPDATQKGDHVVSFFAFDGHLGDTVTITINVIDPGDMPCLSVFPDAIDLNYDYCMEFTPSDTQYIHINNCGGGILNWSIDSIPSWMAVAKTSGTGNDSIAAYFDYSVDTTIWNNDALYSGQIIVSANGALNSPRIIDVNGETYCRPSDTTLVSAPGGFNYIFNANDSILFRYDSLYLYETHNLVMPISLSNSSSWLMLPSFPTDSIFTPTSILFSINAWLLDPGVYADTIVVTSQSLAGRTLQIPVIVTIIRGGQPSNDSVWISTVPAVPGDQVMVPIYFKNSQPLFGINLPMKWSDGAINLDSITFDGTRVSYVDVKPVAFDNITKQAHILIMPSFTPAIPAGRGLMAKMHFTVDASAPQSYIMIDTMISQSLGSLQFIDSSTTSVPTFIPGAIVVKSDSGYVCGRVIDIYGNEIENATVELWDNFPGGSMMIGQTTDINGQFACHSAGIYPFDAYAYKEGYYPGTLDDIQYGEIGFDIVLTPVPPVIPTPEWVNFYCANNYYQGVPLPVGSVIDAFDPQGVHCGTYYVTVAGSYGLMPVYRDDPYTIEDDGAEPGDLISFFINGYPATASGDLIWTEKGDNFEACLDIFRVEEREIALVKGWNLISWNVDTPDDYITTLLAPISECLEVVLGFEQGGFTYDPELPEFSTLWKADHFHGYWVKMTCDTVLVVKGTPVAATTPIALETGWNLVSYLPIEADSTGHALGSIYENLIVALGYDGQGLTYDPNLPEYSTLTMMAPGFGYWVKVNASDMLIYPGIGPSVVYSQTLAKADKAANKIAVSRLWLNLYSYELKLDNQALASGTEITAVTENGRVLGAATVSDNGKFGFMPVYGDDPTTAELEGIVKGEKFSLVINGVATEESFIWSEAGQKIEVKSLTSRSGGANVPTDYGLFQNYPNPFNPATSISFSVPATTQATLDVFNILGMKVATVFDGMAQAGRNEVIWDGKNNNGEMVASGIYFYRLKTASFEQTRKMVLMK